MNECAYVCEQATIASFFDATVCSESICRINEHVQRTNFGRLLILPIQHQLGEHTHSEVIENAKLSAVFFSSKSQETQWIFFQNILHFIHHAETGN